MLLFDRIEGAAHECTEKAGFFDIDSGSRNNPGLKPIELVELSL